MADEAVKYLHSMNAVAPDKPFFLYYVPGGTHSPHQPTKEWIDKIHAMHLFDDGWEKLRETIFANQKKLGVIPPDTQLTPWPDGQAALGGAKLPRWDSLSAVQKKLYIRQAEVFAAYAAYTDYEIGRVIQEVQDQGKLDNTLIIYICGDNGTSPEGTLEGTYNTLTAYNGILTVPEPLQLLHYEDWGSDKTYPHMAVGWTWAFDTPFKWTKQVASHFGGTRQGMAISWPGHITDVGGIRTQFHHVIDIVPTLLEATGIKAPELVNGIPQKPIEGVSMAYTFDKANANAPSKHDTQYFEMVGNRAIYHDGWVACYDAALSAVDAGCHDARAWRLQVGALQRRQGLFREQRSRGATAGQAQGNAGVVPDRGGENTRSSPWTTPALCASWRRAERGRRQNGIHLHGCERRHSLRQRAQHLGQGLHHHR